MSISTKSIDAISARLSKAEAITHLLLSDCQYLNEGFQNNPKVISDAIWAVCEFIQEAKKELLNKGEKQND